MDDTRILGQEKIIKAIQNAYNQDKIANAYIIDGTKGSGREQLARLFAMLMNCLAPTEQGPCFCCSSCKRIAHENHANITYIQPDGNSIKIKQITTMISSIARLANEYGKKVIILEDAEKMTEDAQNAFLKTLEEPPKDTIFLLLTTNFTKLLITVQSRCQILKVQSVRKEEIRKELVKEYTDTQRIDYAVTNAKGSIQIAREIMEDSSYFDNVEKYMDLLELTNQRAAVPLAKQIDEMVTNRQKALELALFFLELFRDILLCKEMGEKAKKLMNNANQYEILEKYAFSLTNKQINDIIEVIMKTAKQIQQNVSFVNTIDYMLFSIMEEKNG